MSMPLKRDAARRRAASGSSRMTESAVIDLPEPDSPTRPITSPASIDRSMSLRIGTPPIVERQVLDFEQAHR